MLPSKTMKRIITNGLIAWTLAAAFALLAPAAEPDSGELDVVRVRPNFYMIAGAGGNIGVQIGSDGVVLVNAGAESASGRVLAAVRKIDRPADPLRHRHQRGRRFRGRQRQTGQSRENHFHQCAWQCRDWPTR